jgi:hypothetical protein
MPLLTFQAAIHARPPETAAGPSVEFRGLMLPTVAVAPGHEAAFPCTFEEVAAALEQFPRLYFEPDGSFVWVAAQDEPPWQLDGLLFDRNGRVLYLELKGTCPAARLDAVLAVLGRSPDGVLYQLLREGVLVDDATFRRYAAADAAK